MISYKKVFHGIIWILFLSFLVLYFAQAGGYYEDLNNKKTYLTEEKIKEFEKDVRNGKQIKVENYVINLKKDYGNKVSSFGLFTSKVFSETFKWSMSNFFNAVDRVMNE